MTRTPLARPAAFAALLFGLAAAAAPAADVVILKDGFVIQGALRKESEPLTDKATGQTFLVPKGGGFDQVDDGPRITVFSGHHKQLGEVAKDAAVRPDYKAYQNPIKNRTANNSFPEDIFGFEDLPDFDAKWRRTLKAKAPGTFHQITQQVTYLDPYCCFVVSTNYFWTQTFRTSEMDPQKVRKLLLTHPTLSGKDAPAEPLPRLAVARFMLDAGWLQLAKEDVERVRKDYPGPLAKEAQEQLDQLAKDVDGAVAALAATEAEAARKAGRYQYAADLAAAFPHKTAPPKAVDRITKVQAELKAGRDGAEAARRHLRRVLDEVAGSSGATPLAAATGGPAATLLPAKATPQRAATLAAAGERVLAEIHPDTADRVGLFVDLAGQAEKDRAAGRPAGKGAEELLATAVSGWAKGRNGATAQPEAAVKVWAAREAVLAYQRAPNLNARTQVLTEYKRAYPLGLDELAQVISLLPPAEPEDLAARSGEPVRPGNGVPPGVYRRKSAPHNEHPAGVEYLVRLPPEYHHGRAYPVLIVVAPAGYDPEQMFGAVAAEADRHGYILLAPVWAGAFGTKGYWEWKGEDHDHVTGALRDAVRHFTVENDRVFLLGFGTGADMAMDVGASHPDLFAGVVPICPNPRWNGFFMNYWTNAQKLPFYVVTGQQTAGAQSLRFLFEKWMPNGFPAVQVTYKGRGVEWFPAEVPVVFDWMGRKRRPTGSATLKLDATRRFKWTTHRPGDDRFYWLGAERIDPKHLTDPQAPRRTPNPASLEGDIVNGNVVSVRSVGVRTISVWLGKDMIDWSQPVKVNLNGAALNGWRPKVLEPDMAVLLEDYWLRGDRRMLYLARLEVKNNQ